MLVIIIPGTQTHTTAAADDAAAVHQPVQSTSTRYMAFYYGPGPYMYDVQRVIQFSFSLIHSLTPHCNGDFFVVQFGHSVKSSRSIKIIINSMFGHSLVRTAKN